MSISHTSATMTHRTALTHFAGRAGDHNDRAMVASRYLTEALAGHLDTDPVAIGEPEPALSVNWDAELAAALPSLQRMAARYEDIFTGGQVPVTALSRCTVALATLPVVAAHRPDAVVVWFDAHADLNTPANSATGYLGGMAFSAPLGMWDSGLGSGLRTENAVLVGARDIDGPEQGLIDDGTIALVPIRASMADDLRRAVAGRPVYVHIDCDVLDAGTVPTDYLVPGGLTLDQLHGCVEALAESEVVGIEIGELEADTYDRATLRHAQRIVTALRPVIPHG